jgi:drug/metabolite transporter (DMT)-like permease
MLAVLLALGTSVAYGTSNFLGPQLGRRHTLATVLLVSQLAALAGAVAIVLASGHGPPPGDAIVLGLLAGVGNILGLATFYRAAELGPVSIAAAIGATGTVMPVVFGLATGEEPTVLQTTGIVAALAGATLAAQRGGTVEIGGPAAAWAAVSAVGFGGFLIALPEAADDGTPWALLDARIAVVVLLVAGVLVLGGRFDAPARRLPLLSVPGLLLLLGTLMYAEATKHGLISVVSVLASLATVVTAALSYVVLHERLSTIQRVGIALATIGVALLAV